MAVTKKQGLQKKSPCGLIALPVKLGQTIYFNTIAGVDSTGYLVAPTSANIGQIRLAGIVADDSIADPPLPTTANGAISGNLESATDPSGDKTVRTLWTSGQFQLPFTGLTQADLGKVVYAKDNFTFSLSPVAGVKIGTLVAVLSATSGYVDLNKFYTLDRGMVIAGLLTAATGTGGGAVLSLANPIGMDVVVKEFVVKILTGSTGAATIDIGVAANGTTTSDTLLDGINAQTVGYATIGVNGGTNGKYGRTWSTTGYITGTASATLAGMVAEYYMTVERI